MRLTRIIIPLLTFAVGALAGVIYGWTVARNTCREEFDKLKRIHKRLAQKRRRHLMEDWK